MIKDYARYLEKKPTQYSRVQLAYRPSEALDDVLHEFIKPEYRHELGTITLRSESYVTAPLLVGRRSLEHPPEWAQHLLKYKNALAQIATHQIRLASFVEYKTLEQGGLAVYFELLPDEFEQRKLGQLALGCVAKPYGAVARISKDLLADDYGIAASKLRTLAGVTYGESNEGIHRTKYAPREQLLWVDGVQLQDRSQDSTLPTAQL